MARKAINDALSEAEIVATDAVRATNQVLVDAFKQASADGKLTKEEAVAAMTMAKSYFLNHMTAGSKQVLEAAVAPLSEWLGGFLEAKLATEKVPNVKGQVATTAAPLSSGPSRLGPIRYGVSLQGPAVATSIRLGENARLNVGAGLDWQGRPRGLR